MLNLFERIKETLLDYNCCHFEGIIKCRKQLDAYFAVDKQ